MKDYLLAGLLLLLSILSIVLSDRSLFWLIIAALGIIFAVWDLYDTYQKHQDKHR